MLYVDRVENATKLYKSLLGIDESFALGGTPPTSLLISFNILKGAGKKSLSIQLGPGGRMTGAKVRCSLFSNLLDYELI